MNLFGLFIFKRSIFCSKKKKYLLTYRKYLFYFNYIIFVFNYVFIKIYNLKKTEKLLYNVIICAVYMLLKNKKNRCFVSKKL